MIQFIVWETEREAFINFSAGKRGNWEFPFNTNCLFGKSPNDKSWQKPQREKKTHTQHNTTQWLTRGRVAGLLLSVRAGVLPRKFQRDLQPDGQDSEEALPEPRESPHGEYGWKNSLKKKRKKWKVQIYTSSHAIIYCSVHFRKRVWTSATPKM